MAELRTNLLFAELSMFFIIQALALYVGAIMIDKGMVEYMPAKSAVVVFFVAFLLATTVLLLVLRFLKGPKSLALFFGFVLFVGIRLVFDAFLPVLYGIVLAVIIVMLRFWKPTVLIHNIAIFIALAGVSAKLGTLLPVLAVIIILAILSVYDVIAVFKTKHMVKMFKGMISQGLPIGIVIPEDVGLLNRQMKSVSAEKLKEKSRKTFIMLGGGDLSFPAVFAVSALAHYGWTVALAIVAGAMVGMISIHFLLLKKNIRALPALPPIAAGSILGFVISAVI